MGRSRIGNRYLAFASLTTPTLPLPQGREVYFRGDRIVEFGAAWDPARAGFARLAGDTNCFFLGQKRIPGRGGSLPPRSGVHAIQTTEISLPETALLQATGYRPQTMLLLRTTNYAP